LIRAHRVPRLACVLAVPLASLACTTGQYQNLGAKLDVGITIGVGSTTWIAPSSAGTQLLVLGADGGSGAPAFMETAIAPDGATVSESGTYAIDSKGTRLTLDATLRFILANEINVPVLKRKGATRQVISETTTYGYELSGNSLTLTGTPALGPFTFLPAALAQLGATSAHDAECAYMLALLTLDSSQVRIPGFNGPGTTQYFTAATFEGTLAGQLTFQLNGSIFSPHGDLAYVQFSDFDGITLGRTLSDVADTNGDGYLYGTVSYQFSSRPSPTSDAGSTLVQSGTIFYGNPDGVGAVPLMNGAISGGSLQVTMDSNPTVSVPYSSVTLLDVSRCVPPP
jgi:hypothetical protein